MQSEILSVLWSEVDINVSKYISQCVWGNHKMAKYALKRS